MCSSKSVTVPKRNTEISSKMSQRRYESVMVPKVKDRFIIELKDWSNGAKTMTRQLSSLVPSKSYGKSLLPIKLFMIIRKHIGPAISLTD
jgi:hypothetical protein